MITLVVRHDGRDRLALHLLKAENDEVAVSTYGLVADDAEGAVQELRLLAAGARLERPLLHITASPARDYSEDEWQTYWTLFEEEFDLQGAAHLEARHRKRGAGGRTAGHAHRVYLALTCRLTGIDLSHSYPRAEKVSRLAEFRFGERLTRGKHSQAVVKALEAGGHHEAAEAMRRIGHLDGRRVSATTPAERAQSERKGGMSADEIATRAWTAWRRSHDARSFVGALADLGLSLAAGDVHVRVMDVTGMHLDLRRKLNQMAQAHDGSKVLKADVERRLLGLELPSLAAAMQASEPLKPFQNQLWVTGRGRLKRKRDRPVTQPPAKVVLAVRHSAGGGGPRPEKKRAAPDHTTTVARPRSFTPAERQSIARFRRAVTVGVYDEVRLLKERYARAVEAEQAEHLRSFEQIGTPSGAQHPSNGGGGPGAVVEAAPRRALIELDRRRRVLAKDLSSASIGRPGWRDRFKAELASVDARFGPLLAWVDRLEAERTVYVVLKTRETIVQTPDYVVVDIATPATAEIMVAYAVSKGWKAIEIWGGDEAWRAAIMDAAREVGLTVSERLQEPAGSRSADEGSSADTADEPDSSVSTSAPLAKR